MKRFWNEYGSDGEGVWYFFDLHERWRFGVIFNGGYVDGLFIQGLRDIPPLRSSVSARSC
jgi:hypothetical protein